MVVGKLVTSPEPVAVRRREPRSQHKMQWAKIIKDQSTHRLGGEREGVEEDRTIGTYSIFSFGSMCSSPYKVKININGSLLNMEIDTGASLSVMSEKMYQEL